MAADLEIGLKITADQGAAQNAQRAADATAKSIREIGDAARTAGAQADSGLSQVEGAAGGIAPEAARAAESIDRIGREASEAAAAAPALGRVSSQARAAGDAARVAGDGVASFGRDAAVGGERAEAGFGRARRGVESISQQLSRAQSAAVGFFGAQTLGQITDVADGYKNLRARIDLVAGGAEAGAEAFERLLGIANRTQQPLQAIGDLYNRVGVSLRDLGKTQDEILAFTESVAQGFRISGAGAAEANAAIIQLAQGLGSGTLRGDELNSVLEQGGRVAQALADGLGVSRGALRGLAEEGKLTSEVVFKALQSQASKLAEEYKTLPQTVGGAITELRNNFTAYIGQVDEAGNITERAASLIQVMARNLETISELAAFAGEAVVAAFAVKGVRAAQDYAAALVATEAKAAALAATVRSIAFPLALAGVVQYGDELGELVARWTGVDDAAKKAAETQRAAAQAEIELLNEQIALSLKYDLVRIKGAEEAARLSDEEREQYRESLNNKLQLEDLERRRALLMVVVGTATEEQYQKELQGYLDVRTALQQLDGLQGGRLGELQARTADLVAVFGELKGEIGKVADDALARLASRVADDLPKAKGLAEEIGKAFIATGSEGDKSAAEIANKFSAANGVVRDLQTTLDALRAEQFRRLGVDAAEVLTGIDAKARGLLDTFRNLVSSPDVDLRLIAAGAKELLQTLDSPAELQSFIRLLEEAATKGRGVPEVLEQARKKMVGLREAAEPAAKAIAEAFKFFGIQTSAELEKAAEKARQHFETVRNSGQSAATGLNAAFRAYAEAQLAAAATQGDVALAGRLEALKVTAATEAQSKIVQELGVKYGVLKSAAGDAGKTAADGHNDATKAAASEFDSITALINARAVLSEADQRRIRDIREEAEALREKNSLVNAANRVTNLKDVSAAAASIDGRGAVGFGADGTERLAEIEQQIRQAIRAGRLASDALGDTRIESPADIAAARRQLRDAQGLAARLGGVTGSQAVEARTLSEELERGAAALERAVARFEREAVNNGGARTVTPNTNLGRDQIVFNPGGTASPQQPAPLPTPQPIQTIRVELVLGGQVIPGLFTQNDAQRLVDLLERSQLNAQGGG